MADIKLFRLGDTTVEELEGRSVAVEKSLQLLIERHLEAFLGVRFLATEYTTGKTHGGRIDTLGLDENGCPVIIEYKRSLNENVINQGLYYLDWLLDHKGEFELLVLKKLGTAHASEIDWANPRLLCIAGDFTKYDEHAVQQINRNVELLRYRRFGNELFLLELVTAVEADDIEMDDPPKASLLKAGGHGLLETSPKEVLNGVTHYLQNATPELRDLYESLKAFVLGLGADVQAKTLKWYFAFKRIKNFACVEVHANTGRLVAFVKVDPDTLVIKPGFTRDVRTIGHFGTGDLEITIRTAADLERAKPLLVQSYEAS